MSTRRSRKWIFRTVSFALALSVTTLVIEGFLVALRHVPAISSPPALREIARELYMLDRNMIQFEAAAASGTRISGTRCDPVDFGFEIPSSKPPTMSTGSGFATTHSLSKARKSW